MSANQYQRENVDLRVHQVNDNKSLKLTVKTQITSVDNSKLVERTHTRSIDDKSYQVKIVERDGKVEHFAVETTMEPEEIRQFDSQWQRLWVPDEREDQDHGTLVKTKPRIDHT